MSGPKGRSGRERKISPTSHREFFFVLSFLSFVLSFLLTVYLYILCLHVIPLQNTTQTLMPPAGFESVIPASRRPQAHSVDRAATGIGRILSPHRPAHSESLYELSYSGQQRMDVYRLKRNWRANSPWCDSFYFIKKIYTYRYMSIRPTVRLPSDA